MRMDLLRIGLPVFAATLVVTLFANELNPDKPIVFIDAPAVPLIEAMAPTADDKAIIRVTYPELCGEGYEHFRIELQPGTGYDWIEVECGKMEIVK